jgi:hypothetical protein
MGEHCERNETSEVENNDDGAVEEEGEGEEPHFQL